MATLKEIDTLTEKYAARRNALAGSMAALQDEQRDLKRKYLPGIKRLAAQAKEALDALEAAIAESREHFQKRRTLTLHGIRVGFKKGTGKIEFDDAERVVKLIRKHFPEQFDVLVKTKESPIKDALAQLPADQLKKLGIEVAGTGDVVFIKDAVGDVDKLVDALLEEEADE